MGRRFILIMLTFLISTLAYCQDSKVKFRFELGYGFNYSWFVDYNEKIQEISDYYRNLGGSKEMGKIGFFNTYDFGLVWIVNDIAFVCSGKAYEFKYKGELEYADGTKSFALGLEYILCESGIGMRKYITERTETSLFDVFVGCGFDLYWFASGSAKVNSYYLNGDNVESYESSMKNIIAGISVELGSDIMFNDMFGLMIKGAYRQCLNEVEVYNDIGLDFSGVYASASLLIYP
ncbi:MAG TPA: hypothetical protein PLB12_00420 [Candidatus Goldiibacteriota bacterium]|nr:hypothetical protein [Candidatus Goldiibacteriota bacterium]HPN64232.1 hypothetical protein [Candidatus Goldiibacteriota bacterium]HRQ42796.1 hypothetical protein [Candidatus Goldiibacteriota bacterium]